MRIGFIGDIVGRPGRKIIKENLAKIKKEYEIDFVIANGENASHGFGLTVESCSELLKSGIDLITGGNHSFDKKKEEFVELDALAEQSCAWKENNIEYDNIAMSDLFSKLNRKFNVDIRVNSEQILNEEVRVSFRNNENVDEILSALKELVPMQVERQGNTITIN